MVALQIRDVPDDVRARLAASARARGQSLQAYLLDAVLRQDRFERNRSVLESVAADAATDGPTDDDVLAALDDARR